MTEVVGARVEVLTAEVRALMVGSRQVTLSVFRQLDTVDSSEIEPMGRVNFSECHLWLVGMSKKTGALVRANWTSEWSGCDFHPLTDEELPKRPQREHAVEPRKPEPECSEVQAFAVAVSKQKRSLGSIVERAKLLQRGAGWVRLIFSPEDTFFVATLRDSPFGLIEAAEELYGAPIAHVELKTSESGIPIEESEEYRRAMGHWGVSMERWKMDEQERQAAHEEATKQWESDCRQKREEFNSQMEESRKRMIREKATFSALPLIVLAGLR